MIWAGPGKTDLMFGGTERRRESRPSQPSYLLPLASALGSVPRSPSSMKWGQWYLQRFTAAVKWVMSVEASTGLTCRKSWYTFLLLILCAGEHGCGGTGGATLDGRHMRQRGRLWLWASREPVWEARPGEAATGKLPKAAEDSQWTEALLSPPNHHQHSRGSWDCGMATTSWDPPWQLSEVCRTGTYPQAHLAGHFWAPPWSRQSHHQQPPPPGPSRKIPFI